MSIDNGTPERELVEIGATYFGKKSVGGKCPNEQQTFDLRFLSDRLTPTKQENSLIDVYLNYLNTTSYIVFLFPKSS